MHECAYSQHSDQKKNLILLIFALTHSDQFCNFYGAHNARPAGWLPAEGCTQGSCHGGVGGVAEGEDEEGGAEGGEGQEEGGTKGGPGNISTLVHRVDAAAWLSTSTQQLFMASF